MSTKIESTVKDLPAELAKSGASGDQHVFVTILDDDEAAKLEKLRAEVQVGLDQAEQGAVAPLDMDQLIGRLKAQHAKTATSK